MNTQSRTLKSLKNSGVALLMYFINLLLQFWSRKIFLDYLGTEILGLNTTATNLLQFLNLAELGVGSAIGFTLYKPIFEKDYTTINEIVTLQGQLYRRIAVVIIGSAIILMAFFPFIFKKMQLPIWYAYASFGVLLFSSLLSYFVNYKQIILSASQEEYKIQLTYKLSMLCKILFQMVFIYYFKGGYIWWLLYEVVFAVISSILICITVKKSAPYLSRIDAKFKDLRKRYFIVITKVKQMFFHKIAGFALLQISPLIIYAYTSLTMVALYGNYMIIYLGITSLVGAMFNGINASIGNLAAENENRLILLFKQLYSLRFMISIVLCFLFYTLTPKLIPVWIGQQYLLPQSTLLLMTIMLFIGLTRLTVENYLQSLGMFQDVWAPITESIVNIGLSIVLGKYYGLNGVLCGIIISLILFVLVWKPYFLFHYGFKTSIREYLKIFISHLLIMCLSFIIGLLVIKCFSFNLSEALNLILYFVSYSCIIAIVSAALFSLCNFDGMKLIKNSIEILRR